MSEGLLPPSDVRRMFDRIAPRYDLMNQVMSVGLHHRWRRSAAARADLAAGERALDCCCGTGDLALALADRVTSGGAVVGIDFAAAMLDRARRKSAGRDELSFQQADATALPFADDSFQAATMAFGIRNIPDRTAALSEMMRVVESGRRVVILEITTPDRLRGLIELWFQRIVPRLGALIGREPDAYSYLPASTLRFPRPERFAAELAELGLHDVRWRCFMGGLVALHDGRTP